MCKIKFIVFLILIPGYLYCQEYNPLLKGGFLTGGYISSGFTSSEVQNSNRQDKQLRIEISPQIGYFIVDKLPIGLDFTYNLETEFYGKGVLPDIQNTFLINPFFRYYFNNYIFFLSKVGKGYGFVKEYDILAENNYFKYLVKYQEFCMGLGYSKFLKENIAIEIIPLFYFEQSDSDVYFIQKQKSSGFKLSIGFQYYFNK